jgi:hypothetical protein
MIFGILPVEAPYICACCILNLLICMIPANRDRIPDNV